MPCQRGATSGRYNGRFSTLRHPSNPTCKRMIRNRPPRQRRPRAWKAQCRVPDDGSARKKIPPGDAAPVPRGRKKCAQPSGRRRRGRGRPPAARRRRRPAAARRRRRPAGRRGAVRRGRARGTYAGKAACGGARLAPPLTQDIPMAAGPRASGMPCRGWHGALAPCGGAWAFSSAGGAASSPLGGSVAAKEDRGGFTGHPRRALEGWASCAPPPAAACTRGGAQGTGRSARGRRGGAALRHAPRRAGPAEAGGGRLCVAAELFNPGQRGPYCIGAKVRLFIPHSGDDRVLVLGGQDAVGGQVPHGGVQL